MSEFETNCFECWTNRWIATEDRLPPKNKTILALTHNKKVRITRFTTRFAAHWGVNEGILKDSCFVRSCYSHWRLLPELPK